MPKEKDDCPKEVPILGPEAFCKDALNVEDLDESDRRYQEGSHCLLGWTNETFENEECRIRARIAILDEIMERAKSDERDELKSRASQCQSMAEAAEDLIPRFNDRRKRPLKVLAAIWNAAMKRLGYTQNFVKFNSKTYKRLRLKKS